jgi:hypothetical protein
VSQCRVLHPSTESGSDFSQQDDWGDKWFICRPDRSLEIMDTPKSYQRLSKNSLIVAPFFYFISLFPAAFYAFFLLIAANGVVSDTEPGLIPWKLTMLSLLVYPIGVIVCLLFAWYRYRRGKFRSALIITLLPLVEIPLSLALGAIALVGIATI